MPRTPFEFLTNEDLNLLEEKAEQVFFRKGELILEEGSRRQSIFIVREGTVRIERMHSGKNVAYVRLGPGEIFGEMSFVENQGASASVLADSDTTVDVVEGHRVNALMASVPGFGTRFYQSLAVTLAHRLRATSMMIPPLMVDEAPYAKRSPESPDNETHTPDQLSPDLVSEVQSFRREMLKIDRSLKFGEISEEEAQRRVSETSGNISSALALHVGRTPSKSKAVGSYVFREVFPFFMLSKRFDRLYTKPRGYAADFHTIDLLCGGKADGSGRLGKFIDQWLMDLPLAKAFINRREFIKTALAGAIDQAESVDDFRIAAISAAQGPSGLLQLLTGSKGSKVTAIFLDSDSEALSAAALEAKNLRVSERITVINENPMRLVLGKGSTKLEHQHVIYGLGLLDYMEDEFVLRLLNWLYNHLMPGGTAILVNFEASNPDKPFMDHILDWQLFHRKADRIRELIDKSGFSSAMSEIQPDGTRTQLFITLKKV